jgi:hypothetical protein
MLRTLPVNAGEKLRDIRVEDIGIPISLQSIRNRRTEIEPDLKPILVIPARAIDIGMRSAKKTGATGYLVEAGARSSPPQWK